MQFHPIAELFPLLSAQELDALAEDIKENGLITPICTYEGKILDGRNRFLACQKAGAEPVYRPWSGTSAVQFAWSQNGARRHLDAGQRACISIKILPLLEAEAAERRQATLKRGPIAPTLPVTEKIQYRENDNPQPQLTARLLPPTTARNKQTATARAAQMTGTNAHYVADARRLSIEAPAVFEEVAAGKKTIIVARRELEEQKREDRREENRQLVTTVTPIDVLAAGAHFPTIVIDPRWDSDDDAGAKPDYATMSIDRLMALPIGKLADIDCHLYLWVTNRSLPKAFDLLDAWGFRYVTMLTWVKPSFGMGNYFRGQTEHVLFGIRGSQPLKRKDVGTVFYAPRPPGKGHSAKPPECLSLVESCSPGPYLEVFSRSAVNRPGWSTWGESGTGVAPANAA